jgi:hypothetical protein
MDRKSTVVMAAGGPAVVPSPPVARLLILDERSASMSEWMDGFADD